MIRKLLRLSASSAVGAALGFLAAHLPQTHVYPILPKASVTMTGPSATALKLGDFESARRASLKQQIASLGE